MPFDGTNINLRTALEVMGVVPIPVGIIQQHKAKLLQLAREPVCSDWHFQIRWRTKTIRRDCLNACLQQPVRPRLYNDGTGLPERLIITPAAPPQVFDLAGRLNAELPPAVEFRLHYIAYDDPIVSVRESGGEEFFIAVWDKKLIAIAQTT